MSEKCMFEFKQRGVFLKKYLSVLRACTLFQGLSDGEILSALNCIGVEIETREKNEYILRAGERTDSVGLLLSGTALIIQEDLWGNRNVITRLIPGDFFAESFAVIPDTVLSVSVVATEPCETMKMNVARMLTVCSSACGCHIRLIHNLVTALARKLLVFNSLGKYQIQSRQKEQLYTKDKTALNVILSNCTKTRSG